VLEILKFISNAARPGHELEKNRHEVDPVCSVIDRRLACAFTSRASRELAH
jgi:hypothetical protein